LVTRLGFGGYFRRDGPPVGFINPNGVLGKLRFLNFLLGRNLGLGRGVNTGFHGGSQGLQLG